MDKWSYIRALLGIAAIVVLVSCGDKPQKLAVEPDAGEPGRNAGEPSPQVSQELQGVRYSHSKGGNLQWELEANSVAQVMDGPASLEEVKITYYSDDGGVVVLVADSGEYEDSTRNATLRGNVVVTTSNGDSLKTDALKWNQQEERLRGEGGVTMSRGHSIINGSGFELFPEIETVTIYDVDGIIRQGDVNP